MTVHAGGGSWKKFEIAASADDDDVVENCTKKRARDEDFENEARKAFNHADGDSGDNNTKGSTSSQLFNLHTVLYLKEINILTNIHTSGRFSIVMPIALFSSPANSMGNS